MQPYIDMDSLVDLSLQRKKLSSKKNEGVVNRVIEKTVPED